jgi:hypothetical protein
LIPADRGADSGIPGLVDLESGISGVEVEFLLIARTVGNMGFAIDPEDPAVSIDHGQRIIIGIVRPLEKADGQHDRQFGRKRAHPLQYGMIPDGCGESEQFLFLILAEIGSLEQFLRQNDLRTPKCGGPHELLGLGDIRLSIPGARHLGCGNRYLSHHSSRKTICPPNTHDSAGPGSSIGSTHKDSNRQGKGHDKEKIIFHVRYKDEID